MAGTGIHPHPHPHTQLKKSGIPHTHTHTQSMRGFPVKTGTGSGNTHGTDLFAISTGNNPPSMNGRRRVMGWGALGCSNLTASEARGGVARDVTG